MNTADLNKPITSTQLNENMFKKFGVKVNLNKYTREELENYRNLLRTKVHNTESKASFNDLLSNETHQKDKHIMNILNQRIKEIVGESVTEGAKVDRMVKHIEKSERKAGKSKKDAENIAWATANKRGMLDNKNKKKTKEGTEDTTMNKTTEALKGKQTKLDKNHNGKLDADDFKMLRAGKKDKTSEEMKVGDKKKSSTGGTIEKTKTGVKHTAGKNYGAMKQPFDKNSKDLGEEMKVGDKKKSSTGGTITKTATGVKHSAGKNYGAMKQPFDKEGDSDMKKKKVKESHKRNVKIVNEAIVRFIIEDEEGKAKSITAGTDMVNDFTSWMTRVGQYQTKSMIELADAIRANFGQQEAETFKGSVQPALDAALQALTQAREEISNSVAVLAGEAPASEPMGGMDDMSGMDDMENPGQDDIEGGDEFAGSDAAAGGMETPGREMRESRKLFASKLAESHNLMRSLAK
jgi:hypothetical protein